MFAQRRGDTTLLGRLAKKALLPVTPVRPAAFALVLRASRSSRMEQGCDMALAVVRRSNLGGSKPPVPPWAPLSPSYYLHGYAPTPTGAQAAGPRKPARRQQLRLHSAQHAGRRLAQLHLPLALVS
jgi:hypothetical protein